MTTLKQIQNKTTESRQYDQLKEYPLAIRKYLSGTSVKFDNPYYNRSTDAQLRFLSTIKYDMQDRDYGSNNEDIANIYLNMLNSKGVQELIDSYIFNRQWVYHPVRKFEKWNTLSHIYYNEQNYYWLILVFNRIVDPFQDLLNFNLVRIPNLTFLNDLPSSFVFRYTGGDFDLRV